MALSMTFIAILPYTKLKHIILIPLNYIINSPKDQEEIAKLDTPFNILDIDEESEDGDEALSKVGFGSVDELEWKERLQFISCVNCGRCEENCPAYSAGRKLSPRNVIQKISDKIMWDGSEKTLIGDVITRDEMWGCTNCYACIEVCPAFVKHVDHFINMRRYIVNTNFEDESKITLLSNIERNGNPYGLPSYERVKWLEDDGNLQTIDMVEDPDILYFIGCSSCYNPRCQEITDSVISILKKAEVDFFILGEEERCCGEPAKRIGEEGLFQMIAIQNIELFNTLGAKHILVHCPHCYNMLKYEYRDFGGDYEVVHHSEFINSLIHNQRINIDESKHILNISYHDPCNLGRLNSIYEAPRKTLQKMGVITELPRNKEKSFCCGGGGGNAFYQIDEKKRISSLRIDEAINSEVNLLASACPFCMIMFEDAAGNYNKEIEVPEIKDIAEIVIAHSE
jgi:Fe-S oxidoreductase